MFSAITNDIKVTVVPQYEEADSNAHRKIFSYKIIIENQSVYSVQLLSRYWLIFDSIGSRKEVKGDGVIGEQPVLEPNETHSYQSYCILMSSMGTMKGYYRMINLDTQEEFNIRVPKFEMVIPECLN